MSKTIYVDGEAFEYASSLEEAIAMIKATPPDEIVLPTKIGTHRTLSDSSEVTPEVRGRLSWLIGRLRSLEDRYPKPRVRDLMGDWPRVFRTSTGLFVTASETSSRSYINDPREEES